MDTLFRTQPLWFRVFSRVPLLGIFIALTNFSHAALPQKLSGLDLSRGEAIQFNLEDSPSKPTVVVFLSAKCPCSISHEPVLADLYQEFNPQGVRFIGIHSNADEDLNISQSHFREAALPFPVLQDQQAKAADAFGALKTPHVYILQNNEVVYQGGVDDSQVAHTAKKPYLKDALEALVQGKKPKNARVRTLGCRIKR